MSKSNDDFFCEKKPWSLIKDQLLACYLKPYFSKLLATRRGIFYVDGFAGKGMFDDGKPGSPIIALDIISDSLTKTNFKQTSVESRFIELVHYAELEANIAKYQNARVVKGKYEDNIEQLLQNRQSQNVFLYIDPYGVKSLYFSVFEKLSTKNLNSIELLVNLNSFGFIREACNAMNAKFDITDLEDIIDLDINTNCSKQKSIDDLTKVAGGDYWKGIIEKYKNGAIDGYGAEIEFSISYCKKLREYFEYVLNIPIRLRKGQRPKYRMIHATNHEDGCVLMNDNMCKRWEVLQDMQNGGQMTFFQEDPENNSIDNIKMRKEILDEMQKQKEFININVFLAKFIIKYGVKCSTSDICKELEYLNSIGKIEVKRHPVFTDTGRPSKFWTVSKDRTVKVRCL